MSKQRRVLLVCTGNSHGGAELSTWNLFRSFIASGHASWLAVGKKSSTDPQILLIPNEATRSRWYHFWTMTQSKLASANQKATGIGLWKMGRLARFFAEPGRQILTSFGLEDFSFPGSRELLSLPPATPDIVHCFNLHGGYFDLRILPWLSRKVPVILDLRDTWLLSGHCAYTLGCDRWKTGCGHCPDLTIYPPVRRDQTRFNWNRKRKIYAKSRVYVAAPCQWMVQRVEQSMLWPAVMDTRVIPTGMDLMVFHPVDKAALRARLGIPQKAKVLLFTGVGGRKNMFKDFKTMRIAVALVAERLKGLDLRFIALGEDAPPERIGHAEVTFIPFQNDPNIVAQYYQAADVYVHAAKVDADSFPRAVLESLACGTPVVATAVCGIPEQIKGLRLRTEQTLNLNCYNSKEATGVLVPPGDAEAMADGIEQLLTNDNLRLQLGENAAIDARIRFNLQRQSDSYWNWYQEILERRTVENRDEVK